MADRVARIYCWRGVVVDSELIEKRRLINCRRIRAMQNIEQRRVMIEIYGEARFIQNAGAKIVSQDEFGTLYRLELKGDEAITMVRVQNSTPEMDGTYKYYFLRVPPHITTAREAIAWTFGLTQAEYNPEIET